MYKANFVSVAEISGLLAEWDWVKGQKNFGAFNYTTTQKLTDIMASTTGMASGTFGGKPITSGAASVKSCATAECVAGLMPAPSEMRTVDQVDKDLKTGVCKSLVGNVVNTLVPGSMVMRPIIDSAGKAIGWAVEKGFDKTTSNLSGGVICKG